MRLRAILGRMAQQQPGRKGGPRRCAFCGRSRTEVSYLHVESEWACICNGCVYDAKATRAKGPGRARRCSFCGAEAADVEWIFGGSKIAICNNCVERCVDEIVAV
jgi:hypothetical protein